MKLTDSHGSINSAGMLVIMFATLASIAAIGAPAVAAADAESWTFDGQGCYVHTYHNNHVFSKDVVTINTYCKENN